MGHASLPPAPQASAPRGLATSDAERARRALASSLAESTRRAYLGHWAAFGAWCGEHGYAPAPAAHGGGGRSGAPQPQHPSRNTARRPCRRRTPPIADLPRCATAGLLLALAALSARPAQAQTDATLSDLTLSTGTLSPTFASTTESYTAGVENSVSEITVAPTTADSDATVAYLDGSGATIPDANINTGDQQVALVVGANVIQVNVTAEDGVTTKTYRVQVTRANVASPVCDRTPAVRDEIVQRAAVSACADVTAAYLAAITELDLDDGGITSLTEGDFSGLSALTEVRLGENDLTSLPEGVFSGLSSLTRLELRRNDLTSLPEGVFSGLSLSSVTRLWLNGNPVNPLPVAVSLEAAEPGRFRAVAPTAAPFALVLPVSVLNGAIDGGATTLTISAGTVHSDAVSVTRSAGTTSPITADIGTLPGLPSDHNGYALVKSPGLPLTVLDSTEDADVTGDGTIDEDDALVMYYAYGRGDLLGDGEQGGTAESRQRLLGGLSGEEVPGDEALQGMLRKANAWRSGETGGDGDINGDGELDADDALAMYHAYRLEDLLGDGEEGGAARFRQQLLGGLGGEENSSDAVLRGVLRKANAIRNPGP